MSASWRPCPLCRSTQRRGHQGHPDAACAHCGALERHRALVACLQELHSCRDAFALEIAPFSDQVYGAHLRELGYKYTSADAWRTRLGRDCSAFDFIDHDADASDLYFARSGAYQLVVAQRALERVVDYVAALDELARVCDPGGRVVLEVLLDPRRAVNERLSTAPDGVAWSFGLELLDALDDRFAEVKRVALADGEWTGEALVCRGGR